MPSFCTPLGEVPKPAITRPFAGQRNVGSAPVASAVFAASLGEVSAAVGVTIAALWAGSLATSFEAAGTAALACATDTLTFGAAAEVRTPGIERRSPILSGTVGRMLLALAISPIGLP